MSRPLPAITAAIVSMLPLACSSSSMTGTTAGTGGASSTSTSSGGTGGGSSTSSSSGGAGLGGSCKLGDPGACAAGLYCNAPDCTTGACASLGTDQGDKAPVCGCDGVTYWNGATASSHGMSVAHSGACTPGTPCGGTGDSPCAAGQACNTHLGSLDDCSAPSQSGECWGMPTTCPVGVGFSATSSACDSDPWCADECSAIQSGKPWFDDGTCPM